MPTRQKPLLRTSLFPEYQVSCEIKRQIRKRRVSILKEIGFCEEYGGLDSFRDKRLRLDAAKEVLAELAAILENAVWEYVERDSRALGKLKATLIAIEQNPSLATDKDVEIDPVAMDHIEAHYQRVGEGPWPNPESTQLAARKALAQLAEEVARRGPPEEPFKRTMAGKLVRLFLRFSDSAGRSSPFKTDEAKQVEAGKLLAFMKEIEAVLIAFFRSDTFKSELLKAKLATKTPRISAEWLTRGAAAWRHRLGDIP